MSVIFVALDIENGDQDYQWAIIERKQPCRVDNTD
jgi:hypothetical protein